MTDHTFTFLPGPNLLAPRPVTIASLAPGALTAFTVSELATIRRHLEAAVPGLQRHRCRHESNNSGHLVEHVTHALLGVRSARGCRVGRCIVGPGEAMHAVVDGNDRVLVVSQLRLSLALVGRASRADDGDGDGTGDLRELVSSSRDAVAGETFRPQVVELLQAAEAAGVPWLQLESGELQLGHGAKHRRLLPTKVDPRWPHDDEPISRIHEWFGPMGNGRIPIVAIAGSNGRAAVAQLVATTLRSFGRSVGLLDSQVTCADAEATRRILADPEIEFAVLETDRAEVERSGLGYDWCDIGLITNGAWVEPGVVEVDKLFAARVRRFGTLVLNAHDRDQAVFCAATRAAVVSKHIVYFCRDAQRPLIGQHLRRGGTAYVPARGWVVEMRGRREQRLVRLEDIPCESSGDEAIDVRLATIATLRSAGIGSAELRVAFGGKRVAAAPAKARAPTPDRRQLS